METRGLKTGLFGYSKVSVCEYIAKMNEEFTKKLMDTMSEHENEKKQLKEKLERLEAEVDEYKKQQAEVSDALLDAKRYAAQLKAQADLEHARLQKEHSEWNAKQQQRIRNYEREIDSVRDNLLEFAKAMESDLDKYKNQLAKTEEQYEEKDE